MCMIPLLINVSEIHVSEPWLSNVLNPLEVEFVIQSSKKINYFSALIYSTSIC